MSKEQILPVSQIQLSESERIVTPEQSEIITADPASFLVACSVLLRLRDSITELKDLICHKKPEMEVVFDKVLSNMANGGLLKIFGDQYVVLKTNPHVEFAKNLDLSFLPKIASMLCEGIIKSAQNDTLAKAEHIRWYYSGNHPEIEKRLFQIHRRYQEDMEKLMEWSEAHPECVGDKVRLTMVMSGNLSSEDVE